MPDLGLDLRYLRNLIVAAEQGSFRRAADVLGTSQASVTRRVQLLERRLGFIVFDRSPTGITLTKAGARFLSEAARGVNHFDRAIQLAASANRGERGVLHVGILTSLNCGYLREVLLQFRGKHPSVEVVVHEATPQESLHCLAIGHLDVSFLTGVPAVPGYLTEMLWSENVFVAMPLDHPLAANEDITWGAIRRETFIVSNVGPGPEIHDYLVRRLSRLGFRPDVRIQQVGRESLMNLVAIGYGLSLISTSSLGHEVPGIIIRPFSGDGDVIESSATWSSKNSNPALRLLLNLARTLKSVSKSRPSTTAMLIISALFAPLDGPVQILDLFL